MSYPWGVYELSLRCVWVIPEVCMSYTWGVYELYLRCVWVIPEVCMSYPWGVYESSLRCVWVIPEVCMSYTWGVYEYIGGGISSNIPRLAMTWMLRDRSRVHGRMKNNNESHFVITHMCPVIPEVCMSYTWGVYELYLRCVCAQYGPDWFIPHGQTHHIMTSSSIRVHIGLWIVVVAPAIINGITIRLWK